MVFSLPEPRVGSTRSQSAWSGQEPKTKVVPSSRTAGKHEFSRPSFVETKLKSAMTKLQGCVPWKPEAVTHLRRLGERFSDTKIRLFTLRFGRRRGGIAAKINQAIHDSDQGQPNDKMRGQQEKSQVDRQQPPLG